MTGEGEDDAVFSYLPRPFDTGGVKISQDIKELVDLLARHSHEVWARDKMKDGWKYAPDRSQVRPAVLPVCVVLCVCDCVCDPVCV